LQPDPLRGGVGILREHVEAATSTLGIQPGQGGRHGLSVPKVNTLVKSDLGVQSADYLTYE